MSPGVDPSLLDEHVKIIRERRGPDAIHNGDEQSPVARIPVDFSPQLMRITSGGIPLGRMTRFWGEAGVGKTNVLYRVLAAAQKMQINGHKGVAGYYNIEKQYDVAFAARVGIDTKKLKLVETTIIEDVARELQLLLGSVHVHGVDSCSQAIPQDRLLRDPAEWDMALDARVWMKALDYIHNQMDKDYNAIIYLDHESRDFKTQARKAPGGKEMEHASSLSLHFKKGSWLYYDDEGLLQTEDRLREKGIMGIAGQKEADGTEVLVRCNKSRICRPFRVAVMRFDLNTYEFDTTFELLEGGLYFDHQGGIAHRSGLNPIIKRSGKSGWYDCVPKEGTSHKIQGERAMRLHIREDEELRALILKAMLVGN